MYLRQRNIKYIKLKLFDEDCICGIVGWGLKGLKVIGFLCRTGGKTLSLALKPISPAKAKIIHQNARKIAYACERLNTATKGAIVNALIKAGVSKKTAESIADILLMLI